MTSHHVAREPARILRGAGLAAALLFVPLLAPAARAAEPAFTGGLELPGSPGLLFQRCAESKQVKATGPRDLTFTVRASSKSKLLELTPLIDGAAQKPRSFEPVADTGRGPRGVTLTKPLKIAIPVPAGDHQVGLRCSGADEVWIGLPSGSDLALDLGVAPAPHTAAPPAPAALAPPPLPEALPLDTSPLPSAKKEETRLITATPARPPETAAATSVATTSQGQGGDAPPRWSLEFRAGGDRSSESYTDSSTVGHFGGEVGFRPIPRVPILLGADLRLSTQRYRVGGLGTDGSSGYAPAVSEQRTDVYAASGYDLGDLLLHDLLGGRFSAIPLGGLHYLGIRNGTFPADFLGVEFGLRLRYALSPGLTLLAGGATAFNFLHKHDTLSAVGRPFAVTTLRLGLALPIAGGHALELEYEGDLLAMTYDTRVSHGVSLGLRSVF